MAIRTALLIILAALSVVFIIGWRRAASRGGSATDESRRPPSPVQFAIGFVTNFFDTLALTLGGIPGVLLAGLVVQSLPLDVLRWVVVFVVAYAATMMLRSAIRNGT
jgi:uncharacterized membrane protein YfcA